MQQNTSYGTTAVNETTHKDPFRSSDNQTKPEGNNNHLQIEAANKDCKKKTTRFQNLHRFINCLTLDVDESNLHHHHDVLTTISTNSVPDNDHNIPITFNENLKDNSTSSSDTQRSDESTRSLASSFEGQVSQEAPYYQLDRSGRIEAYIDLQELDRILDNNSGLQEELKRLLD